MHFLLTAFMSEKSNLCAERSEHNESGSIGQFADAEFAGQDFGRLPVKSLRMGRHTGLLKRAISSFIN